MPFQGDYAEFRRVLHHELVHAVFNDMFYGGSVQSIIQNNIQLVFPLWFEEGMAEHFAGSTDSDGVTIRESQGSVIKNEGASQYMNVSQICLSVFAKGFIIIIVISTRWLFQMVKIFLVKSKKY